MIREALRQYPYIGFTLVALVLFVSAFVGVLVRALRAPKTNVERVAALPLEDR